MRRAAYAAGVRLNGTVSTATTSGEWDGWWTAVSPQPRRSVPTLTASMLTVSPDDLIWFEVALDPAGRSIAAVQNDVILPPPLRIQECVMNPQIDKSIFWAPLVDASGIRVLVLSFSNSNAILAVGPLYRCAVTVPADAEPGRYSIHLENAAASDPVANPKQIAVEDGSIQVAPTAP